MDAMSDQLPGTDVLVVLGGDGTFLRAARAVAEIDVPLLGINVGKVGFLSKVEAGDLIQVLDRLRAGEFTLEHRMALEGRIIRAGSSDAPERHIALNDVVVARLLRGSTLRSTTATWRPTSPTGSWYRARPARRATHSRRAARSSTRRPAT